MKDKQKIENNDNYFVGICEGVEIDDEGDPHRWNLSFLKPFKRLSQTRRQYRIPKDKLVREGFKGKGPRQGTWYYKGKTISMEEAIEHLKKAEAAKIIDE